MFAVPLSKKLVQVLVQVLEFRGNNVQVGDTLLLGDLLPPIPNWHSEPVFQIYDIPVLNGESLGSQKFSQRLQTIEAMCSRIKRLQSNAGPYGHLLLAKRFVPHHEMERIIRCLHTSEDDDQRKYYHHERLMQWNWSKGKLIFLW
jgi:hypothetical protein